MQVLDVKNRLVRELAKCGHVKGIGQTGDPKEFPIPGYSDIDLFVLCDAIPSEAERVRVYETEQAHCASPVMHATQGGMWGHGDVLDIDGVDVMFMFFTLEEMRGYVEEVLQGEHLGREGAFYPTGRLSSVEHMHVLYECEKVWETLKERVNDPPEHLFGTLFTYHAAKVLDEEDLGRVLLRRDVLFFHQVLEEALDHLLQALFAMNRTYFPSRKRSGQYLASFQYKPDSIHERLLEMVAQSVSPATLGEAVTTLRLLAEEVMRSGAQVFDMPVA